MNGQTQTLLMTEEQKVRSAYDEGRLYAQLKPEDWTPITKKVPWAAVQAMLASGTRLQIRKKRK